MSILALVSSATFLVAAFGTLKVMLSATPPGCRATGTTMLIARINWSLTN